ncbi:MAG: hypothetical protein M0P49_01335 [Bacilli bacterium]|jgi:TM2 domain-containing membrane protein YozV|nr:hypothetical protein [Bacilli bacterium]MDD4123565.1 hypothetical protein [Bacilli bacterium]MDD4584780.1 hypothetical protein [Bacilli bacterium]
MNSLNEIVKSYKELPIFIKLILAMPGIDSFSGGIYRIAKGKLLAGILWIILGWAIFWILDIISIVKYNDMVYFA